MSGAISGLDANERANCRRLVKQAAWLTYRHKSDVHYTQGPERWQGIDTDRKAWRGDYPNYADCSAFATWCLWNGLDHYHIRDTVNHAAWKAGWTGTMLQNGKQVQFLKSVLVGDCVIYGASPGRHTAIVVGWRNNKPMVISHGSEAGPFYLPYDYRGDINSFRRYS
jgi:hypothetical protein